MVLQLYNTLTRRREVFEPAEPGRVKMYVCGITAYAPSHVGHARAFVAFDVLARWLRRSHTVTYVRNFTDVDDKIIKAAAAEGVDPAALAHRFARQFQDDMERLKCLPPDVEPRVTDHIEPIIAFIEKLAARGFAYVVDGDVYFEVARAEGYGRLSGRTEEDSEAGARVEVDPRKRSPRDFALWKAAKPGEPAWESPWGRGRPGWHIECSAMSAEYLGETFDIHGGGKDLVFPHHENELAQSCAAHGREELARYWVHNGFINLLPEVCPACGAPAGAEVADMASPACAACGHVYTEDELKMSKSRGNFFPVRDIIERCEPEALRLLFLTTHYRKPIQFSVALLGEAERRLDRGYEALAGLEKALSGGLSVPAGEGSGAGGSADSAWVGGDVKARLSAAMDDDLNTPKVLAELSELFRLANELVRGMEKARLGRRATAAERSRALVEIREILSEAGAVLGLWQERPLSYLDRCRVRRAKERGLEPAAIEERVLEREAARAARDFARSDALRAELSAQGIVLMDAKDGSTRWDVMTEDA